MYKRLKLQKLLIVIFAVILAVTIVTILVGRSQTINVVVLKSDKIDLSKPLDTQLNMFGMAKISQKDYQAIGGKFVTNLDNLKGKYLQDTLETGSPVLTSMLDKSQAAGEFAKTMPLNYTTYKIANGVSMLPPGTVAGDRINVALTVEVTQNDSNNASGGGTDIVTGVLLNDIPVFSIDKTDVYIKVTDQEALELSNAQKYGEFVLQLPGKKQVETCATAQTQIEKSVDEQIAKEKKKNPTKKFNRDQMIQDQLQNLECTNQNDEATKITKTNILDMIQSTKVQDNSTTQTTTSDTTTSGYNLNDNSNSSSNSSSNDSSNVSTQNNNQTQ